MNAVTEILDFLLPVFVIFVLPVMVVWLVTRARIIKNEQKMTVLIKAIENGIDIDPALLVSETEGSRNTKMELIRKLIIGIICAIIGLALIICTQLDAFEGVAVVEIMYIIGGVLIAIGTAYTVAFYVGRKYLAPEIEAEEKKLQK